MNKILLIIQREYVTRVRKKSFIVMIFVVPCLILAMGFAIYMVGKNSTELGNKEIVKVLDESGQFEGKFKNQIPSGGSKIRLSRLFCSALISHPL